MELPIPGSYRRTLHCLPLSISACSCVLDILFRTSHLNLCTTHRSKPSFEQMVLCLCFLHPLQCLYPSKQDMPQRIHHRLLKPAPIINATKVTVTNKQAQAGSSRSLRRLPGLGFVLLSVIPVACVLPLTQSESQTPSSLGAAQPKLEPENEPSTSVKENSESGSDSEKEDEIEEIRVSILFLLLCCLSPCLPWSAQPGLVEGASEPT